VTETIEMAVEGGEVTGVRKIGEAADDEIAGGDEVILQEGGLQVAHLDAEGGVVAATAVGPRDVVTAVAQDLRRGGIEADEVVLVALPDEQVEAGLLTDEGEVVLRSEGADVIVANVEAAAAPAVRPRGVLGDDTGSQDAGIPALAAAAVEVPRREGGVVGAEGMITTCAQWFIGLEMRLNSRNMAVAGGVRNGSQRRWISFTEVVCTVS